MEQVSFRVHVRAVAFASKVPLPLRRLIEVLVLALALLTWALIAGLHTTYINLDPIVTPSLSMGGISSRSSSSLGGYGLSSSGNCLKQALVEAGYSAAGTYP